MTRLPARHLILAGALVAGAGFVWQASVSLDTYLTTIAGPAIIIGIGGGLMSTPLATAVTSGINPSDAGAASGLMRFPPNRRGIDNEEHDAREAEEVRPGVS
jgi:hypothetical protein